MFFTADHHFGHSGIIDLCRRPFRDAREMDDAIVDLWNSAVGATDDVWHLGDLAHKCDQARIEALFRRLRGRKRLVIGNHDHAATLRLPWLEPPTHLAMVKAEGRRLVLCHYGLRVWPGVHREAIHLYGHSHGRLAGTSLSADVGVDSWSFRPASLDEVLARLRTQPSFANPEGG